MLTPNNNEVTCDTRCVSFSHEDSHNCLNRMGTPLFEANHDAALFALSHNADHLGCQCSSNKCSKKTTDVKIEGYGFSKQDCEECTKHNTHLQPVHYLHIMKQTNSKSPRVPEPQLAHFRHFRQHTPRSSRSSQDNDDSVRHRVVPKQLCGLNNQLISSHDFLGNDILGDDDHYGITEINFDFMTLTDYNFDGDDSLDPASVSLVDMICGIPDTPEDSMDEDVRSLLIKMPMELTPEPIEAPIYTKINERHSPSKKRSSTKKSKASRSHKHVAAYVPVVPVVAKHTQEEPLPTVNLALGDDENVEWYPGFNRQLGAKGRSALLDLVRRVYRQDPVHYKAILQARNPPSSISNLPFFNIPMLWELTHQFGVFKQALMLQKNQLSSGSKYDKNKSKAKSDKVDVRAPEVPGTKLVPMKPENVAEDQFPNENLMETPENLDDTMEQSVPVNHFEVLETNQKAVNENQEQMIQNVDVETNIVKTLSQPNNEDIKSNKNQTSHVENNTSERAKQVTSSSGRSIKPTKRYVDYQDEFGKAAKRFAGYHISQKTKDEPTKCSSIDSGKDYTQSTLECSSPALSHSTAVSSTDGDDILVEPINTPDVPAASLVWCVAQQLTQRGVDTDRESMGEHITPVSSARDTPTRYISV
ncbi:hypothetical protein BaOVIS_005540 [Babesia ovis]|uniref:Uncharacterized protein n=1 Tax=Babesia ovis TaxID=5869 RepID=A0A9W5T968_BABOV|nr:hypothetical protein BaOVIS_005540 [Babesia ovis]